MSYVSHIHVHHPGVHVCVIHMIFYMCDRCTPSSILTHKDKFPVYPHKKHILYTSCILTHKKYTSCILTQKTHFMYVVYTHIKKYTSCTLTQKKDFVWHTKKTFFMSRQDVIEYTGFFCARIQDVYRKESTGRRRLIGSLIFIGHFMQKWPIFGGSFVENDLQLKGSYESSPPCTFLSARVSVIFQKIFRDSQRTLSVGSVWCIPSKCTYI